MQSANSSRISIFDYYRPTPEADLNQHYIGSWVAPEDSVITSKWGEQLNFYQNTSKRLKPDDFYVWHWRKNMTGILIRCLYFKVSFEANFGLSEFFSSWLSLEKLMHSYVHSFYC